MNKRSFLRRPAALLLAALLALSLAGCGKKEAPAPPEPAAPEEQAASEEILAVRITPANLYDYFEYREYPTEIKGENSGEISSVQIAYGLALRPGYTAANDPAHKDTLKLVFTAQQVVSSGSFSVDYDTLQYTGSAASTETREIREELVFWPKGDRTSVWTFGNFSSSYILYLQNFTVVSAEGTVYLRRVPLPDQPAP